MMSRASGRHWCILTAVCTLMWGVYFIYDLPASLSISLQAHLGLSDSKYAYLVSALYTAYAAPNSILPFFSGPLVQRFGEKFALLLTLTSVVLGQLVFVFAVHIRFQSGMILGRFLLGLGAEIMGVLGTEVTTRWFRGKRLSLALAMNLASWRLGSVTNSILVPRLAKVHGVVAAGWMGTVLALGVSILSAAYLMSIKDSVSSVTGDHGGEGEVEERERDIGIPASFSKYPWIFWQLGLICMLGYGSINTFTNSAQRFLAFTFYGGDQRAAGSATSIPYILSSVLVPPLGLLLDLPLFNHYPAALIITGLLMFLAHLIFLISPGIGPIPPLCLLGIAYALFGVAFWTSLTRCLIFVGKTRSAAKHRGILQDAPERCYGTVDSDDANQDTDDSENHQEVITFGFGVNTSLMNMATGAVPILLAGAENFAGYAGLEMVFLALAGLGCLASVQLAWMWNGV